MINFKVSLEKETTKLILKPLAFHSQPSISENHLDKRIKAYTIKREN